MGAVPVWRAKLASVWKRSAPAVRAIRIAAVKVPQPDSASSCGRLASGSSNRRRSRGGRRRRGRDRASARRADLAGGSTLTERARHHARDPAHHVAVLANRLRWASSLARAWMTQDRTCVVPEAGVRSGQDRTSHPRSRFEQTVRRSHGGRRDRCGRGSRGGVRVPRPNGAGKDVGDADDRLRVADDRRRAAGPRDGSRGGRAAHPGKAGRGAAMRRSYASCGVASRRRLNSSKHPERCSANEGERPLGDGCR
jgi:hypothetical protein